MDTLGGKIRKLRKQNGLSQEELGYWIGVTRQTISKWEANDMQPNAENIKVLCSVFSITTDSFLVDNDVLNQSLNEIALCNSIKNRKVNYFIVIIIINAVLLVLSILATLLIGFVVYTPNKGFASVRTTELDNYSLLIPIIIVGILLVSLVILVVIYIKKFKCK